jgi:hypothetical protein
MAFKPPLSTYARNYYVGRHAIERFRERIVGTELHARPDTDLGNALDCAVVWAIAEGRVERVKDRGGPASIVTIDTESDEPLYAVIKKNTEYGRSTYRDAIVTVMTREQVETMREHRWGDASTRPPRREREPFNPALAALKDVKIAPAKAEEAAPMKQPTASPPPPTERRNTDEVRVLVSYRQGTHANVRTQYEEYAPAAARQRVAELIDMPNVVADSIRLWVERPMTIKREVKVEVEL